MTTSLPGAARRARELARESVEIAVRVAMHLAKSEPRAVDERRVIEPVEEDVIAATDERRERAEARLIARGEDERRRLVEERGEPRFERVVQIERAVEEPASGGSGAIAQRGAVAGLEHFRMMREPEVVVRADHDLPHAADPRFGRRRLLDRREVRIDAHRLNFERRVYDGALIENAHVRRGRWAGRRSASGDIPSRRAPAAGG